VTNGLGHTGRIVTAAACLLAVSFFPFGTAKLSFMQPLGLVCAPLPAQGP
jgi:RND superfamily putative drug exporter